MSDNLKIDLEERVDSQGQKYFIGKLKSPITIDCKDGVVFLVFASQEGLEQLQIGPLLDKRDKK
jgi:hypothetical protein